jgi:hypothetical protein
MSKVTEKGSVVFSTLKHPKGFKGSDENRKYTIGVKFSGESAKTMAKTFTRHKQEDSGIVVYFNRKEGMGAPEVRTDGGTALDQNILDKGTEVQVAYSLKEYDIRSAPGVKGVSYILDKVKVFSDTVSVDTSEAPF